MRPVRSTTPRNMVKEYFAGFDLSLTASGIIVIDSEGTVVVRGVIKSKTVGAERLNDIQNAVRSMLSGYAIKSVCIEGYSMGFGAGKKVGAEGAACAPMGRLANLGELGGVIRLLLFRLGVPYKEIAPTSVKKYATGKGQGPKDQITMYVYKNWKFEPKDNNEADAYVLARMALSLNGYGGSLSKEQQETINVIKNPKPKGKKG